MVVGRRSLRRERRVTDLGQVCDLGRSRLGERCGGGGGGLGEDRDHCAGVVREREGRGGGAYIQAPSIGEREVERANSEPVLLLIAQVSSCLFPKDDALSPGRAGIEKSGRTITTLPGSWGGRPILFQRRTVSLVCYFVNLTYPLFLSFTLSSFPMRTPDLDSPRRPLG
jgi:hypothetical protein